MFLNMKLPAILSILCLFTFSYSSTPTSHSCSSDSQEPCEPFDILHEMAQIPKFNPAKHSVIAKYCLHYKTQKDSTVELLLYERIANLSIKKQKGCNFYSISEETNLKPDKIFMSISKAGNGFCTKTCTGSRETCEKLDECKVDISEIFDIYGNINFFDINSCLKGVKGMEKISHLFNRYLPIKWDWEIYCDFKEKIPISGSGYIYISEICTEEQLKKNEE